MQDFCKEIIYLDYAATAPLCFEAFDAMQPYLKCGREAISQFANPNSLHAAGRHAFSVLEESRKTVAASLGAARPSEIIFTSGATEADNAAIFGLAFAAKSKREQSGSYAKPCKIITSSIEHKAVSRAVKELGKFNFQVEFIEPTRDGFIEVSQLEKCINQDTVLVSIQLANSEIGSIQPIKQLAELTHSYGAIFHTDATQALGKIPLNLQNLCVDSASFSSHKIGGPKGMGALYIKARTPFLPHIYGGGQESGRRSGTQDICSAAGFAAACVAAINNQEDEHARLMLFRDILYERLCAFPEIQPTVEVEPGSLDYLPNIVNVLVSELESETLTIRYDSLGFEISDGSACAASSLDPSHVLLALGIPSNQARGELRVSFGAYTTQSDIDKFIDATSKVLDWQNKF